MSSTRHVQEGAACTPFGLASAPQYAEQRGICGTIVAAKARLMDAPEKRSRLFFLQAQSMRPGGLKRLAQELVEIFPARLGSRTLELICLDPKIQIALPGTNRDAGAA